MNARPELGEAARKLGRSLAQLADSTADYLGARLERVDEALQAERHRALWMSLSAGAALLWLSTAVLFAGVAVVVAFWDSNRVLATLLVAAGFFVLGATAVWTVWIIARRRASLTAQITRILALILERRRLVP